MPRRLEIASSLFHFRCALTYNLYVDGACLARDTSSDVLAAEDFVSSFCMERVFQSPA